MTLLHVDFMIQSQTSLYDHFETSRYRHSRLLNMIIFEFLDIDNSGLLNMDL